MNLRCATGHLPSLRLVRLAKLKDTFGTESIEPTLPPHRQANDALHQHCSINAGHAFVRLPDALQDGWIRFACVRIERG